MSDSQLIEDLRRSRQDAINRGTLESWSETVLMVLEGVVAAYERQKAALPQSESTLPGESE